MRNYSILEDLIQAPYAMSTLEVLHICLAQCKAPLETMGYFNSSNSNLIMFSFDEIKPHLPHYAFIQIHVNDEGYVIWRIVVDEGESTCKMSLLCLKSIDSTTHIPYMTIPKDFHGHTFRPHGIIPSLCIELGERPSLSK
jgi:hypothetical protein